MNNLMLTNIKSVDKKALKIAKQFGYKPLGGLDKDRPYVLLAEKNGRKYVIKTDHFEDEASILKILNQNGDLNKQGALIPKIYEYSKEYLIQDFIVGRTLVISNPNFNNDLKLIFKKLEIIHNYLNKKLELVPFTKGEENPQSQKPINNTLWLKKRMAKWFSDEKSKPKYRFSGEQINQTDQIKNIFGKRIIQFGAFSGSHIRIIDNTIGIFDFGKHICWGPSQYDRAYLWWGLLHENRSVGKNTNFWTQLVEKMSKGLEKTEQKNYWVCIIERLAGFAKDLTSWEKKYGRNFKGKKILAIRKRVLELALKQLS